MSRGTYYRECPICGCKLDPGEICDCAEEKTAKPEPPRKPAAPKPKRIEARAS